MSYFSVWAVDFETPVGNNTFLSFFLLLGQNRQKETINKVWTRVFQSNRPYSTLNPCFTSFLCWPKLMFYIEVCKNIVSVSFLFYIDWMCTLYQIYSIFSILHLIPALHLICVLSGKHLTLRQSAWRIECICNFFWQRLFVIFLVPWTAKYVNILRINYYTFCCLNIISSNICLAVSCCITLLNVMLIHFYKINPDFLDFS
jgi:hypothetical protein